MVNPINQLLTEAHAIFGQTQKVACVLSIGSGEAGPVSINMNGGTPPPYQLPQLSSSARKLTSDEAYRRYEKTGIYHRFSVENGLESSEGLSSHDFGKIRAYTEAYLSQPRTDKELMHAVEVSETGSLITIDSLCTYGLYLEYVGRQ
jgi:hypothetical protein